ncbi:hypothetical protein DSCO28_07870 [Desulfosarcina ovata subsp. sediminis]|uniref:Uncharacterized protein n=1 Tax=Desulfosarcina ovata subsp. sediminis TaxID=885957 RepID=A0A5K7ZH87_9BACT|nr:hypothetical protein [Desulfosarcina ovata]BBO80221.1 hypothetical protein DSCO28_07870 [Desulfosarcina ovata subsp. sediminis]
MDKRKQYQLNRNAQIIASIEAHLNEDSDHSRDALPLPVSEAPPGGQRPLPTKERQFRALNPLKDDPEFMTRVWCLSLKYGGGSARMINLLAQVLKDEAVCTLSVPTPDDEAVSRDNVSSTDSVPTSGDGVVSRDNVSSTDSVQGAQPLSGGQRGKASKRPLPAQPVLKDDTRKLKLQHTRNVLGNLDSVHRFALRSDDPETHQVYSDIVSQLLGLVDNYVSLYDKRNAIHRVAMTATTTEGRR